MGVPIWKKNAEKFLQEKNPTSKFVLLDVVCTPDVVCIPDAVCFPDIVCYRDVVCNRDVVCYRDVVCFPNCDAPYLTATAKPWSSQLGTQGTRRYVPTDRAIQKVAL